VNAPPEFDALLQPLPDEVTFMSLRGANLDVIVLFLRSEQRLRLQLAKASRRLHTAGGLWVGWPKRASGVPTDVTEDTTRDVALPLGLVDNKVAAIDDAWSELRFVVRKEHRDSWPARLDGTEK
jgi:hypothetical protein